MSDSASSVGSSSTPSASTVIPRCAARSTVERTIAALAWSRTTP